LNLEEKSSDTYMSVRGQQQNEQVMTGDNIMNNLSGNLIGPKDKAQTTALHLRSLFEATATSIGDEFFHALIRHLAEALEVRMAFMSEVLDDRLRAQTLAMYLDGEFTENMEYVIKGTPCEMVLNGEINQIRSNLCLLYPEEKLEELQAESYLGIPLIGSTGIVLGHVVAIDDKPMIEKSHDFSTLEVFAARASAELERKKAEESLNRAQARLIQSEKMAVLGQLTAGVAHEINTPIGVIKSNTHVTLRTIEKLRQVFDLKVSSSDDLNPDIQRFIQVLDENSHANLDAGMRITDIVGNLKKFTRLDEAGQKETDLHVNIDSVIALINPSLNEHIRIIKKYGNIPCIHGHHTELNQVFMTLLKNAGESIEGEGTIMITTYSHEEYVYLTIADNGRGIPHDQLGKLFDPGFSVQGSRIGMRLGLSTALSIIRDHGGDISVKSTIGKGTEFEISLPIHPPRHT
jgi:signal transduction histidine kinase